MIHVTSPLHILTPRQQDPQVVGVRLRSPGPARLCTSSHSFCVLWVVFSVWRRLPGVCQAQGVESAHILWPAGDNTILTTSRFMVFAERLVGVHQIHTLQCDWMYPGCEGLKTGLHTSARNDRITVTQFMVCLIHTRYKNPTSQSLSLFIWFRNSERFCPRDIYCSVHPGEGSSSVALLKGSLLLFPLKGGFCDFGLY